MISRENINYAIKNLLNRKVRSFLTIISILVGITTIFIFISFGWGLYFYVEEMSAELGIDKLVLQPRGIGAPGSDENFQLLDEDVEEFRKTKGIEAAAGLAFTSGKVIKDKVLTYQYLVGMPTDDPEETELVLQLMTVDILEGRYLDKGDDGRVVLGYSYQIPKKIYEKPYKVGDKIEINDVDLKIIGFFDEIGNPSDDANMYVTMNTYLDLTGKDDINYAMVYARVDNVDDIELIKERAKKNLRNFREQEEGEEDFFIQSFDELIESFSGALDIVIGFIVLIALISVVVSAVNTANTMFTSILERTKEIGVLKAIGARNSEILMIFLLESGIQGFIAGVFGVLLGAFISYLGGILLDQLGWGFLSPYFAPSLFIGLIAFATLVGTISGMLPAYQASKKNPVDSLRYE